MSKKILLCGGTALVLWMSLSSVVFAEVSISEIMYDLDGSDTDREWIEVLNTGSDTVDVKSYVVKDSPTSSNHALTPALGGTAIPAGGYAIFATDANRFRTDWPDFAGILLSANFTLGNTGETVSIKPTKDLPAVSEVPYTSSQGASGNGRSLQLVSGVWVEGIPTPGTQNAGSAPVQPATNTSPGGNTQSVASTPSATTTTQAIAVVKKPEFIPPSKMMAEIVVKGQVVAGLPAVFQGVVVGENKEILSAGRFYWNFGDGTTKEIKDSINKEGVKKFDHIYKYPGEYLVSFEYSKEYFAKEPDASDRFVVRVTPAEVQISSVGSSADPFVELYNPTSYEMDLSGWTVAGASINFFIPEGTGILPGKKIVISGEYTKFSASDLSGVSLVYPSGRKGFAYGTLPQANSAPVVSASKVSIETSLPIKSATIAVGKADKNINTKNKKVDPVIVQNIEPVIQTPASIAPETQTASVVETASQKQSSPYWPVAGLVGIVGLASGASFAIRKKRPSALGLSAEDIRIVE